MPLPSSPRHARDLLEPPGPPSAPAVFSEQELTARAARVLELLESQVSHRAALLVLGNPLKVLSEDMQHRYRPGSDLFYLTDSEQPHLAALLVPGRAARLYYLDRTALERDGPRAASFEREWALEPRAAGVFEHLAHELESLRDQGARVHVAFDEAAWACAAARPEFGLEARFGDVLQLCHEASPAGAAPRPSPAALCALRQARLRKSPEELARMDRAAATARRAQELVARLVREDPALTEAQLSAHARGCFGDMGCNDVSFPNIVCAGHNCFVLHHRPQRRTSLAALGAGELPQLLLDLGPSFRGYASDFTVALWGAPADPRRPHWARVEAAVRAVLRVMLEACRPGATVRELQRVHARTRGEQLRRLLGDGPAAAALEPDPARALPELTPHGVLHWVGIDVHDPSPACLAAHTLPFEAGFTLALEPALYFGVDFPDKRYRGVAVRLEVSVVVTDRGARELGESDR